MTSTYMLMPATEVRALLTTFRPTAGAPSDATVAAWQQALAGCTFGECQAALLALGPSNARTATPEQIVTRIRAARTQRVADGVPIREHRNRTKQAEYARAGARGIEQVYAVMGWTRNADRTLAHRVACPFCHVAAGRWCRPLSRDRAGRQERRDTATLTHPSRLQRARADHTTTGGDR
jgi:hypothetical protein